MTYHTHLKSLSRTSYSCTNQMCGGSSDDGVYVRYQHVNIIVRNPANSLMLNLVDQGNVRLDLCVFGKFISDKNV